jgi:ribosomal protein S18 acetylase RimI-like enzyme
MTEAGVRIVAEDEQDRAMSVQTMAFSRDPIMRWLYPEADDYLRHFPSFARAFGGGAFAHSTAHVAGDFGGAGLWLPPGAEVDGEAVGAVLSDTIEADRIGSVFEVLEEMGRHHIEEPHWYLAMIGVDPSHQGKGLGSSMLSFALSKCDEAGLPAYLESSNPANVPLYERHGFRVVGTIQVGDVPPVFPMLRDARQGS